MLSQEEESGESMVWYYSCSLSCAKIKLRNFCLTRPELLVVVHFHLYLFIIRSFN